MDEDRTDEKKERLLAALDKGMVMVHLDARRPGVAVPPALAAEAHLRLNLSYRFDPPDLSVNDWGVRCTLSFSGSRFSCAIPWSALFAITSHVTREFWMFPDDMPAELFQQPTPQGAAASPPPPTPARPRAVLREVGAPADPPATPPAQQQQPPPPRPVPEVALQKAPPPADPGDAPKPEGGGPRRGHLRVVK